jgi:hypothetical protein
MNPAPADFSRPCGFRGAAFAVVVGACLFMLFSAWMFYPGWERAFRSDASPVSWLSSALLLTLSVVALRLQAEGALALDEQFMLHELWKYRCHEWTTLCQAGWVRELPMPMVALAGGATAILMHRALASRRTRSLLWAGIATGLWAICVDQVAMPYPVAELEEGFEVLAQALVLAALLSVPPG